MKNVVFTIVLVLSCGYVHAREELKYNNWRSTEIVGAATNVLVATGTIYLKDIQITSGTVTTGTFQYFTATNTIVDVTRSSSIVYDVDSIEPTIPLDELLPGGFFYTTTGSVQIRVRWDWPYGAPSNQVSRGLKTTQP